MKFWEVTIKGSGYKLIHYHDIPGDNEQDARITALSYAPDDIAWTTWEQHQGNITVDVKFKEVR